MYIDLTPPTWPPSPYIDKDEWFNGEDLSKILTLPRVVNDRQPQPVGGTKYDDDKPRMDLLDSSWLEGVATILAFGAKKYAAHNWRAGIQLSRLIAACLRHIAAFNGGEDNDPETGKSHLYHASCCLMFASWMLNNRPDMDDRYKG